MRIAMKAGAPCWMMGLALAASLVNGSGEEATGSLPIAQTTRSAKSTEAREPSEDIHGRVGLPSLSTLGGSRESVPSHASMSLASVLVGGVSFVELRDRLIHSLITAEARPDVTRTAAVALPVRASEAVGLEDDVSHVAVTFALRGASDTAITTVEGIGLYEGALAGADVVHHVHAEGTEDYIVFAARPAKEGIAYDVDVSLVAGLRVVSNTLEFLDKAGAPRLRVAPPYVVDASGRRTEGALAVEGCAFDASPKAPWGRAVTSPGESRCGVWVTWNAAAYPAIVDPSWAATGSMTTARVNHTATLLETGEVLVAGGCSNATPCALSSAELYDPTSGTFAATGSMSTARSQHAAAMLGSGTVLVAGGNSDDVDGGALTILSSAEIYDPTIGTFSVTGSMAAARDNYTATLLASGEVLVAGGGGASSGEILSSAELYDPSAGTFSATGPMTTPRVAYTATLLGSGEVLLAGGGGYVDGGAGFPLSSAELYDSAAGTFAATGSMDVARSAHTATLLNSGQVLVAGGSSVDLPPCEIVLSSAELYDPTSGMFAPTGSMTTGREEHTATLLGSSGVLIAGGYSNCGGTRSSAELYDPAAADFSATVSMTTPRYGDTATLLGTGAVLVAGGSGLSSAELFTCVPSVCPTSDNCGSIPDGCGGTVSCGTCGDGQSCIGNRCVGGSDSGIDSGSGTKDSGLSVGDSGSAHGKDSGGVASDSGSHRVGGDGGAASDGGDSSSDVILRGCGCQLVRARNAPPSALLWLGAAGVLAGRRLRRSPTARSRALRLLVDLGRSPRRCGVRSPDPLCQRHVRQLPLDISVLTGGEWCRKRAQAIPSS
jgi:hypothetical protein